jgi:ATP-dependent protease ClpP protease subunit
MPEIRREMIKDWKTFRDQSLKLSLEGSILIYGEFCKELEEIVLDSLLVARSEGYKDITLLINSFGGRNIVYTAIKGAMALSGLKYRGIVIGVAYSNGFNLLQSCHTRLAISGSFLMFHWGNNGFNNQESAAIEAGETWPVITMRANLRDRVKFVSKRTGVSVKKLKMFARQERCFTVTESLELGFLDLVLPDLPDRIRIPNLE